MPKIKCAPVDLVEDVSGSRGTNGIWLSSPLLLMDATQVHDGVKRDCQQLSRMAPCVGISSSFTTMKGWYLCSVMLIFCGFLVALGASLSPIFFCWQNVAAFRESRACIHSTTAMRPSRCQGQSLERPIAGSECLAVPKWRKQTVI